MSVLQITLTETTRARLEELSRRTGQPPDALVSGAVEQLVGDGDRARIPEPLPNGDCAMPPWKSAIMQAAGMWKDRDDIPELMVQLRKEWNRVEPPDNPE